MVNLSKIERHLSNLKEYLKILNELKDYPLNKFVSNPKLYGSAERFLQVAIESLLNIGNHVIAVQGLRRPKDYGDVFQVLGESGVFPPEFTVELSKMAKFRNKIVHVYWEIDRAEVHRLLQSKVSDLERAANYIVEYLERIS